MPAEPETSSGAQSIAPEPTRPIEQKRVISRMAGDKLFNASPDIVEKKLPNCPQHRLRAPPSHVHPFPPDHQRRRAQLKRLKGRKLPRRPAPMKRRLSLRKKIPRIKRLSRRWESGASRRKPPPRSRRKNETKLLRAANLETQDITATQDSYGKHLNKLKQAQPHELTVKGFMDEFKATVEELAKKLPQDREKHGTDVSAVEVATGKIDAKQKITNQNKKQEAPLQTELATQPSTYAEKDKAGRRVVRAKKSTRPAQFRALRRPKPPLPSQKVTRPFRSMTRVAHWMIPWRITISADRR